MNERICVCGLGKVGKPILDTLRLKGLCATGYDIDEKLSESPISWAARETDAAIFIVPTPSLPNGSFSNMYLEAAIDQFKSRVDDDYLFIISSTTVPGSCDLFVERFGIKNLCYRPEFIRLEYVRRDLLNPVHHLIGASNPEAGERCEEIYRQIADVPVHRMSLIEAELAKITLNCALTMKISLANQLHLVAQKLNADSCRIMQAVGADPRIGGAYLEPGRPYGGPCLPRDNRMFRFVAEKVGVDAYLSTAADMINEAIRNHLVEAIPSSNVNKFLKENAVLFDEIIQHAKKGSNMKIECRYEDSNLIFRIDVDSHAEIALFDAIRDTKPTIEWRTGAKGITYPYLEFSLPIRKELK